MKDHKPMKITFLNTAYTSIGFSKKYIGSFLVDGNNYIECDSGIDMTIQLPVKFVTAGKTLIERI